MKAGRKNVRNYFIISTFNVPATLNVRFCTAKSTFLRGGGGEIRTRGILRYDGLVNRCHKPLGDSSNILVRANPSVSCGPIAIHTKYGISFWKIILL